MRHLLLFALFLAPACAGTTPPTTGSSEAPDAAKPAAREANAQPEASNEEASDDEEAAHDASRPGCAPTGCSGQICAEVGAEIMTTCEFRPEYACYRTAACERQDNGECGFTDTPELRACLADPPAE